MNCLACNNPLPDPGVPAVVRCSKCGAHFEVTVTRSNGPNDPPVPDAKRMELQPRVQLALARDVGVALIRGNFTLEELLSGRCEPGHDDGCILAGVPFEVSPCGCGPKVPEAARAKLVEVLQREEKAARRAALEARAGVAAPWDGAAATDFADLCKDVALRNGADPRPYLDK